MTTTWYLNSVSLSQNRAVTDAVQTIAESYKCKPIEGMLSHQLKQFEIDGEKSIIQNPNEVQRKEHEKTSFELHEVYAIDVLVSSGEGVVSVGTILFGFSKPFFLTCLSQGSRDGDEDDGLQEDQRDVHVEDEGLPGPLHGGVEQVRDDALLPPQLGGREEGPDGGGGVRLAQAPGTIPRPLREAE